ncbi:hypothetical protein EDB81DRAFT_823558, partial [Dactylonectria macrodidyma]
MIGHDADRETGVLTPAEPDGVNVRSSAEEADERHRIESGNAAEDDERQQEPHTAKAASASTFRSILPKEARRIGEDEGGGAGAGLGDCREEWSHGHKRQVIPGLVRRTRIRRGRSTARTDGGRDRGRDGKRDGGVDRTRASLRPIQPKATTGFPETGELVYPSPGPTQRIQEADAPAEPGRDGTQKNLDPADEKGNHSNRRTGEPSIRTQAFIARGGALRTLRPRELDPERAGLHRGPADTPPAPFGSRRRGARLGGAPEQQAWRHIAPATSPASREVVTVPGPVPELEITSTSNASWRRRRTTMNQAAGEGRSVKRVRSGVRKERTEEERREDLASVLRCLDEEFAEKERLSHNREWCTPVPHERKVSTA